MAQSYPKVEYEGRVFEVIDEATRHWIVKFNESCLLTIEKAKAKVLEGGWMDVTDDLDVRPTEIVWSHDSGELTIAHIIHHERGGELRFRKKAFPSGIDGLVVPEGIVIEKRI